MDERSDENMVAAACKGDKKAYADLVKRYYRHVFVACMSVLGNTDDAEDVAQDAMLKGFTDLRKLRNQAKFGPWITNIAKNMCINMLRRKQISRKALKEKIKDPEKETENSDSLNQAIEKLPQDMRLPLLMYYFDGQSAKKVAETLNISTSNVYLKLRTATKRLHEILIKQGGLK